MRELVQHDRPGDGLTARPAPDVGELGGVQLERLALTVAASELAEQVRALRGVLFSSGLPDEEIASAVAPNVLVLAGDDGNSPTPFAIRESARARALAVLAHQSTSIEEHVVGGR